jgi:thiol-disulfide isomerase/thioredoxin
MRIVAAFAFAVGIVVGLSACAASPAEPPSPPSAAAPASAGPVLPAPAPIPRPATPTAPTAGNLESPPHDDKPAREPIYDESADAKRQIATAIERARRNNRRVLVQWGGNWCPWCYALHDRFAEPKLGKELLYEYETVLVDTGKDGKNNDLAESYGADIRKSGVPYLTIFDASGKPIANQDTGALERKGPDGKSSLSLGHDADKVYDLLKSHEAQPLSAEAVLKEGVAAAKADGKLVLLHFGAPWCVYCRKLDAWLARDEVRARLDHAFVDVKIDVDRMTAGAETFERYRRGSKSAGLPWMAVVSPSAAGRAIATSDARSGNIGFPGRPEEITYFIEMLKKTSKKLDVGDLNALRDSLVRAASEEKPGAPSGPVAPAASPGASVPAASAAEPQPK